MFAPWVSGERDEVGPVKEGLVKAEEVGITDGEGEGGTEEEVGERRGACCVEVEVRSRPARESMMSSAAAESEGTPIIIRSPVSALGGGATAEEIAALGGDCCCCCSTAGEAGTESPFDPFL
jgi:hypothetical protein